MCSLNVPENQENYIKDCKNIRLIPENELDLSDADLILLWDKKYRYSSKIINHLEKVNVVDPTYYFSVEGETYQRLFYRTLDLDKKKEFNRISLDNFQKLLGTVQNCEKGFVFGSGSSLEKYGMKFNYEDGFKVVCNSIVKNSELMEYINPQLLVFGDAQHHTSPNKYAAKFRETLLDASKKHNFFILTKDYFMPLFLVHYPELKNKIIGIEAPGVWDLSMSEIISMVIRRPHKIPWFDKIPGHDEKFNFPSADKFYVRSAGSVLPSYMIPIASTVCDEIYVLGADGRDPKGRKPDDTYIWSYSSSCQFSDELMQTAFDTHPSYFRDRPHCEVMDMYCDNYDELIKFGESMGKKYYSLAPSFISALGKRYVNNFNNEIVDNSKIEQKEA
ncbi:hypothetical protein [Methanogenium cariaci]|uniref:hypothetical protein n=1 Tax=Methanogenium cariaci TaxID=2197 RepID=UPI001583D4EE|nr:hypothetical protein [Methanogenium cariaci]